ncbi:MAG: ABC transporter permease subunit [Gemmatimonadales bacterium]|nr:ABC transporter permease subunit [Gemmatimonadales bacterium]NIN13098.1 ABC transporter permease subunit [Gemmatimonadales bacterium]NIN51182.1 ABC transporter permease subunit [Gemmatimonadales bacterium]NIP08646.1 ABC transporter permease subunit [Gemmatimonadales bacterium]NIR02334.1 ABC transporter permease subunit [Gemmatimonadales bacterium]
MVRYLAVRSVQAAAIVFLVATLTFVLLHLAPGDPVIASTESTLVRREVIEQQRRNFGLDRPIHVQYLRYLRNLSRGDLGYSFRERRSVWHAVRERIPNTLLLATAALLVMFGLGMLIGAVQAAVPRSRADDALSILTLAVYSMPVFWLGLMLMLVFGLGLGWFPVGGAVDQVLYPHMSLLGKVGDRAVHLFLPALTLGLVGAAVTARYQRAAMLDVIRQDFVRTARAKGLSERTVFLKHALRNALLPIVTLFGLTFPLLLSGAVLIESVFAWPGMGKFAVDALHGRDYNVVTGTAIIAAAMVVLGNLLADLLYRVVDPRTRESS